MESLKLNGWYTKNNTLLISLMKFHICINIKKNDNSIFFQLRVVDNNYEELIFNFDTLEESISFTENIIAKCQSIDEIIKRYKEYYKKEKEESIEESLDTITLTQDEVDQAIFEYFSENKTYRVSIKENLTIENNSPKIRFYLVEHLEHNGVKKDVKTLLTEEDIKNALDKYVKFYNYELIDFKYKGGIHRVGYYFDNDTPYYEGIELKVKRLDKKLILKK